LYIEQKKDASWLAYISSGVTFYGYYRLIGRDIVAEKWDFAKEIVLFDK